MKFVALALALLLAVGSQAAPTGTDTLTQLHEARAALDVYLTEIKDSAKKALERIDGTELRETCSQALDNLHANFKTFMNNSSPVTDSVVTTIVDSTAEWRANIQGDLDALQSETAEMRQNLFDILNKHIEEYRSKLQPIMNEYQPKQEELKAKLKSVKEELRPIIAANIDETKAALEPIMEAVRPKVAVHVETVKEAVSPYVTDYAQQLQRSVNKARSVSTADVSALREKIMPLGEEIVAKLKEIAQIIVASYNQR